ncbi:hypothetical protein ABIA25_006477 [Sinorhizobium fredii]
MNTIDKAISTATVHHARKPDRQIAEAPNLPLVFSYDGRTIKPGCHVTEVKAGQFSGLDCGANPEDWSEIFVQLWDIAEGDRTHMTAGKFAAIIRKVSEHVGLEHSAKLTFEVSDGARPMQLSAPTLRSRQVAFFTLRSRPDLQAVSPVIDGWPSRASRSRAAERR